MQKITHSADRLVDMSMGKLSPQESLDLFVEIERSEEQSKRLDVVAQIVDLAVSPGDDNVLRFSPLHRGSLLNRLAWRIGETFERRPLLYPLAGLFLLAFAALCVAFANSLWVSPYEGLTGIDRTAFAWQVRGGEEEDIGLAYRDFTRGEYGRSAEHLERYLRFHPNDELGDYVHYSLGAVYLLDARHTFFSLFPRYDANRVERGLSNLLMAANSTSNERLREESLILSAKGYLMLDRPADAIAKLRLVVSVNGERASEARQIIERLHTITGDGQ
jgi:hypothetical protein